VCSTRLEWIFADLAIMCAGATSTAVFPNAQADDAVYILSDSGTSIVIAEDLQQLNKIASQSDLLPDLHTIVLIDGDSEDGRVVSWATLKQLGRERLALDPGCVASTASATDPDSLATITYTAGTTGVPKGVELTHRCWTYQGAAVQATGVLTDEDIHYLWLPLSQSVGKALVCLQLQTGFETVVDGRSADMVRNLSVVKPTFMVSVPHTFEQVHVEVRQQIREEGRTKRILFDWAFRVAERARATHAEGRKSGPATSAQLAVADRLVLTKVRRRLGGRIRFLVSGSSALSSEITRWYRCAGMPVLQGYGLAETSALSCVTLPDDSGGLGTVGRPLPGAPDGEILIKGPGVMRGYRKRPRDDAEAFPGGDGWFATGDIGMMDDLGRVAVIGRRNELLMTAGGHCVSVGAIEARLKQESSLVAACIVVAEGRSFATALVALDPDAAAQFALSQQIAETTVRDLSSHTVVQAELVAAFHRLNSSGLNPWETIRDFRVLPYALLPETTPDEVSPSWKIRRRIVEQRNADLVESMYYR
jgi:long-chain acyl-CoA synthetase